ncbi:MAG TPA: hypothetical protein VFD84_02120 [Candidatus Binatia bacterium]|nr:hypothetical protein [Candidatus Binatia bacterium]
MAHGVLSVGMGMVPLPGMMDAVAIGLAVLFFGLSIVFVALCARL